MSAAPLMRGLRNCRKAWGPEDALPHQPGYLLLKSIAASYLGIAVEPQ